MAKEVAFSYEIYIGAPTERVWKGLTDGEITRHYVFGTRFESKLKEGDRYAYIGEGEFKAVEGEILEVQSGTRLLLRWKANYDEATAKEEPSRVAFDLTPTGPFVTKLRLVHDDFKDDSATYAGSVEAWPQMLSSLKSILETGKALELR